MLRIADRLPQDWEIRIEDLGNVYGRARIQSCNACPSTDVLRTGGVLAHLGCAPIWRVDSSCAASGCSRAKMGPRNGSSRSNAGWPARCFIARKWRPSTRQDTPPEHVGLTLEDDKTVLSSLQRVVVSDQGGSRGGLVNVPTTMSTNA